MPSGRAVSLVGEPIRRRHGRSGVPSTPGFGVMGWRVAGDARILDYHVAVSEAGSEPALREWRSEGVEWALLFLLLWSENNLLCGLKQAFEMPIDDRLPTSMVASI